MKKEKLEQTNDLKSLNFELFNEDCLNTMKRMKDETVDLIIADPPYFQIKGEFDFIWKNKEDYLVWSKQWLLEAQRILKPSGTLILWGGVGQKQIMIARLAILLEDDEDLKLHRQNWITQRNTRGIGTKHNYMSAREDFLFLTKSNKNIHVFNIPYLDEKSLRKDLGADGKPRKNEFKRVSNVWTDITEASQSSIERCEHPTVKAQKLCDRIIQTHSNENDLIYIPFAGSGSEIISAINLNRCCVASEINNKYIELIKKRINDPKLNKML